MRTKVLMISGIVISVLFVAFIVTLSCIHSTTQFILTDPNSISIYNFNQNETKKLTSSSKEYAAFMEKYKNSFSGSYLEQVFNNDYYNTNIEEDLNASEWSDYNKKNGLFVEFKFEKAQKLIIWRDGSSRQIFIDAFIFKVEESNKINKISVYYSQGGSYNNNFEKTGDGEIFYPIICYGNTSELYEYIMSIIN